VIKATIAGVERAARVLVTKGVYFSTMLERSPVKVLEDQKYIPDERATCIDTNVLRRMDANRAT
jgi:hypothetical protein